MAQCAERGGARRQAIACLPPTPPLVAYFALTCLHFLLAAGARALRAAGTVCMHIVKIPPNFPTHPSSARSRARAIRLEPTHLFKRAGVYKGTLMMMMTWCVVLLKRHSSIVRHPGRYVQARSAIPSSTLSSQVYYPRGRRPREDE